MPTPTPDHGPPAGLPVDDDTPVGQRPSAPTGRPREELSLPGVLAGAALVVAAFGLLAAGMTSLGSRLSGTEYTAWLPTVATDTVARAQWVLGDMTEPQFYKSWIASLGLLCGAALAWWAGSRGRRWAGLPISYGSGSWPWLVGASTLSLLLSNLAYGWWLEEGWQPTFVPFVCVAAATVLVYGRGWPVLLTGAVLGALTTTPVAMLLIATVTGPLELPAVVANTLAMSIGTAVSFLVIRRLPWMRLPALVPDTPAAPQPPARTTTGQPTFGKDVVWSARRVVADFSETQFFANELASIGVVLGAVAAFLVSPLFPAYGTGLLPHILLAQALTSAVGVVVWRSLYRGGGWAPTYVSLVSVAPATVLAHDGSWGSIVYGAVAGALLCPVIARPISARLPADFHPFIGNTLSMAVSTTVVLTVVGVLPGVG